MYDRFVGSMLGLAVGDAVGFPLEFRQRGSFRPISKYEGDGTWTDDTAMALCLAVSLTEKGGMDLDHQMQTYLRWFNGDDFFYGGHVDCGITIQDALIAYGRHKDVYAGSTDEWSAGNGCIMRLAPVPLFFFDDLYVAIEMSAESSRTTHQEARCLQACKYFGALLWGAVNGVSKEELLSPYFPGRDFWKNHVFHRDVASIMKGSFKASREPDSTGFVIHTLEAALWAFYHSSSFEQGLFKAVNLGGDADTTGAVYGQLAGAYYGMKGIPEEWMNKLKRWQDVLGVADQLYEAALKRSAAAAEELELGKKE